MRPACHHAQGRQHARLRFVGAFVPSSCYLAWVAVSTTDAQLLVAMARIEARGFPPTQSELRDELGTRSVRHVADALVRLSASGHVLRAIDGRARLSVSGLAVVHRMVAMSGPVFVIAAQRTPLGTRLSCGHATPIGWAMGSRVICRDCTVAADAAPAVVPEPEPAAPVRAVAATPKVRA